MTRWVIALSAVDYRIQHCPGADIGHADFLSRVPFPEDGHDLYAEPAGVYLFQAMTHDLLSAEAIAEDTAKDPLRGCSRAGPTRCHVPPEAGPYAQKKNSLSVHRGCLLQVDPVVIPPSLRAQVLDLVHATHPGISCSKAVAKAIVWWPGYCSDLENTVRLCNP